MRITYDEFVNVYGRQIDAAYREAHGVPPAITDQFHNAWRLMREGWDIEGVIADIKGQPFNDNVGPGSHPEEMLGPEAPPVPPISPIHTDGKIFRLEDGTPWRWKGVSAFQLLDRFAKGEDIQPFLNAYAGFNILRVWPYVPAKDWGSRAWDSPDVNTINRFIDSMNSQGWYVELTLLTDDDSSRLSWAKSIIPQITRPAGLFIEIGNEPTTHKQIDTHALQGSISGLYASGDYEDSSRFFGTYLTAHTGRDGEWPRRAHDAYEYYSGGGPNNPSDPAHRVPIILDEPPKLQDVGMDPLSWRAYFGAASILAAGATFHSETGKFALPPTSDELILAKEALFAMNAFSSDAPNNSYTRIDENGKSLRTYVVGNYMVRIRPTVKDAPESGWQSLDPDGILWKR